MSEETTDEDVGVEGAGGAIETGDGAQRSADGAFTFPPAPVASSPHALDPLRQPGHTPVHVVRRLRQSLVGDPSQIAEPPRQGVYRHHAAADFVAHHHCPSTRPCNRLDESGGERLLPNGDMLPIAWDIARVLSPTYRLRQERIWVQDQKMLGIWGYPTTYVSNVHHHYCLVFRKED